ncbi:Multiple RNA-binding domain-containing protein 1 [Recurvomyces mirabilis]|uniref:Multiple RNA-binding domain-containing protein 1 n=1 Tax=Recurvomyces mirabilis TaxID=574656 RepID=A0AAE0WLY1_9PEZI|nr:Multiple RNA-binding domain-containing protein 1 [Recurvomyces mirabilis]KAK5155147.1 Multiple RNA-binding domain-containing protein 1 [Recurvomyces mirabilis]
MEDSQSSRIFIKGLPPTFTEADFRKHFARDGEITDAKIFQNRRIGYIGFKTPKGAQQAVKYFNRTFIRMSRINVEIARPPPPQTRVSGQNALTPTTRREEATNDGEAAADSMLKRKRDSESKVEDDPKLKEFLEVMKLKSKKKAWESDAAGLPQAAVESVNAEEWKGIEEGQSDEEYEVVPKKAKVKASVVEATNQQKGATEASKGPADLQEEATATAHSSEDIEMDGNATPNPAISDSDWARSRTSRLLGLLEEDDEGATPAVARAETDESEIDEDVEQKKMSKGQSQLAANVEAASSLPSPPSDQPGANISAEAEESTDVSQPSMRLFIRNLPYNVTREDLQAEFESFGEIEEVHVPLDVKTGIAKGFAYVQFSTAEAAENALYERDGQTFQGRLLHILPATAKRENKLDDFALSKLPLKKQQQVKRKREAESTTFNWNALYMNADAVVSSVAERLGISKSEVLDPTSSDAAIKQAHAETHVIQETKSYFKQQGVDLDAFKKSHRGDTAILVKNIPYDCSRDELRRLFEEHGDVKRFIMPPSGVIAIVEMANSAQCKSAFGALAYRKIKSSVLFLEKAPKGVFNGGPVAAGEAVLDGINKTSASDFKDTNVDAVMPDSVSTATLFVRNLNFSTTTPILTKTFKPLAGFLSARVKTRTDPKKPGQILSMGFGFLEFASSHQAQAALQAMDGYLLEGHKLQIRASHKGADAAEERRKADAAKRQAGKKTKVIIKNLPFEATKKDVRALFGAYGQLRSIRVPKKMDRGARGFAFADFTTPKEAENAMDALRDTHLLGRRLVLDFAEGDPEDAEAEIEKMQKKVGNQVNKVALQKLTSGGRKRFTAAQEEEGG